MLKPRSPHSGEFEQVVSFLNAHLRENNNWSIKAEYPTALNPHNIHNMSIITDETEKNIIAHALIKPIILKTPQCIYKVGAIGSVVTDPAHRQQGLSSLNIQNCFSKAAEQNCDIVMLWTDKFEFYRKFGFELAGFENTYFIDNQINNINLTESEQKYQSTKYMCSPQIDPQAILKLFSQHSVNSFRTVDDIQQFLKIPNAKVHTLWSNQNQLLAYAVEGKGADLQNFIHEWGGSVDTLLMLIKNMVNNEKKSFTIMVPEHSINLNQQLTELGFQRYQGFLGMIKVLNFETLFQKIKNAFRSEGFEKIVFEKQDQQIVFGYDTDLYTLDNEHELVKILFGPVNINELDFIQPKTREILGKILPLPLWVWGWDSI